MLDMGLHLKRHLLRRRGVVGRRGKRKLLPAAGGFFSSLANGVHSSWAIVAISEGKGRLAARQDRRGR